MNKKFFIWVGIGIIILAGTVFIFAFSSKISGTKNCSTIEGKIVKGQSLSPIINNSQYIDVYYGYYNCHPIKRGEIIAYNLSIDPNPIIKIVKGIPGDNLSFENKGDGSWYILINGQVLKTSEGLPYELNTQNYFALKKYAGSVIPKDNYLILGNLVAGSVDSRDFGLVNKSNILGAVGLYTNSSVVINGYVDALGLYTEYYIKIGTTTCASGWTAVYSGTQCQYDWDVQNTALGSVKCAEPGSTLCAYGANRGNIYGLTGNTGSTPISWAGGATCTQSASWVFCAK